MLGGWKSFVFGSMDNCSSKTRHRVQVTITWVWRVHPHDIHCPIRSSLEPVTGAGLWLYLQFNYRNNEGNGENKDRAFEAGSALHFSFDLAQNRTAFEYSVSYSPFVPSPRDEKLTEEVKREALSTVRRSPVWRWGEWFGKVLHLVFTLCCYSLFSFAFRVSTDRCVQKEDWSLGKPSKYILDICTF